MAPCPGLSYQSSGGPRCWDRHLCAVAVSDRAARASSSSPLLPVCCLLILRAIDFGRVFLSWVNLHNTARIAANYAATNCRQVDARVMPSAVAALPASWSRTTPRQSTASFPKPVPLLTYPGGTGSGADAVVEITCEFGILTPDRLEHHRKPGRCLGGVDLPDPDRDRQRRLRAAGPRPPCRRVQCRVRSGATPPCRSRSPTSRPHNTTWAWDYDGRRNGRFHDQGTSAVDVHRARHLHGHLTVSNGIYLDDRHEVDQRHDPARTDRRLRLDASPRSRAAVRVLHRAVDRVARSRGRGRSAMGPRSARARIRPPKTYAAGT